MPLIYCVILLVSFRPVCFVHVLFFNCFALLIKIHIYLAHSVLPLCHSPFPILLSSSPHPQTPPTGGNSAALHVQHQQVRAKDKEPASCSVVGEESLKLAGLEEQLQGLRLRNV